MVIKNFFEIFLNTKKSKEKEIRARLKNATLRDQCVIILEAVHEREKEMKNYDDLARIIYQEYRKYGIQVLNAEKKGENRYTFKCTNGKVIVDIVLKCKGLPEIQKIEEVIDSTPEPGNSSNIPVALLVALLAGGAYAISKSGFKIPDLSTINLKPKKQETITLEEDSKTQEKLKDETKPNVEQPRSSTDELSMCLIDPKSGSILYEKDCDKKMNMASTTKIMTAILGLENCDDLTKEITVTKEEIQDINYSEYTNIGLQEGEKIRYDEVIKGLAIHSACEACKVVAKETENYIKQKTGKEVNFIDLMNKKAKEIGMENTNWTNTYGESTKEHYTSTKDMCKLMLYCMNQSPAKNSFKKYFGHTSDYIKPVTNKNPNEIVYRNTTNNSLMSGEGYTLYGKTGYTDQAEQCWVFCAEDKQGNQIMGAVLSGANKSTIANDVQELIRYGFKCLQKLSKAKEEGKTIELVELNVPSSKHNSYLYAPESNTVYISKRPRTTDDFDERL